MIIKRRLRRSRVAGLLAVALPAMALAAPVPPVAAQSSPIQHVVVIYLENQSFDSVLGYWCDKRPKRCPDGGMPASVTLSDGTAVTPSVDPDTVPIVDHSVPAQVAAMNGGAMNGWQNIPASKTEGGCSAAFGYQCISGYEPAQIPNLAMLARNFAISDMTFSLADSPSWGGHLYAVAASLDGFTGGIPLVRPDGAKGPGWGCNSGRVAGWRTATGKVIEVPSCVPDPSLKLANGGAFESTPVAYIPTIMDRLHAARLSWRIYGAQPGQSGYIWATCPAFAECLDTHQASRVVDDSQFTADAAAGKLPAFSLVTPGGKDLNGLPMAEYSCHNGFSMTACDNWVGDLVKAVQNGPDWPSTAIFITFDDFGGFYDQVYPGTDTNPDGTQEGPRVPLIIVSPYARRHYTDTGHTTFAGILAYTEMTFGLAPLGVNDAQAYPFTSAFDYSQQPIQGPKMAAKLVTRPLSPAARRLAAHPPKALLRDPT
jgi:phospholipase C